MAISNGIVPFGSIILFTGSGFTPEPTPPPVTNPGDQPPDQKLQGYPPLRGVSVVHGTYNPQMGIHVDEFTQDKGFRVGYSEQERGTF